MAKRTRKCSKTTKKQECKEVDVVLQSAFKVTAGPRELRVSLGNVEFTFSIANYMHSKYPIYWTVTSTDLSLSDGYVHESTYNVMLSRQSYDLLIDAFSQSISEIQHKGIYCHFVEEKTVFWFGGSGSWCVSEKANLRFGLMTHKESSSTDKYFFTRAFFTVPHQLETDFCNNVLPAIKQLLVACKTQSWL